ncbi:SubName: Full=Uncharacterized protein {ECO:0000313/EMBL:CCA70983.1} [Serendipita indica DSM 11827]|nr:SubName: Full=Uncharacterized protein {ECO:0000313/EMBL:CCA70983.1} [Serendipita indica DSM 11827]
MAFALAVYSLSARAPQDGTSNTTECLPSCAKQYRSLPGIVLSCLTTIFLCIWVALHLNVPEPVDTRGLDRFERFKVWLMSFIRCTVTPILVTLVFPEWVLGMAVLQFRKATQLAKKIGGTRQQGFFILMGGFHLFKRSQGSLRDQIEAIQRDGEENHPLVKLSGAEEGDGRLRDAPNNKATRLLEEEAGEPVHPLDEFDVCRLIDTGKLHFPPSAELLDRCKSDGLAKFLVIVQTLWFIAQCIARKVSKLPLTELEVVTLGYTLLTVGMYVVWWDKPYRVAFPVRVYGTLPERTEEQEWLMLKSSDWSEMVVQYASGTQGARVNIRELAGAMTTIIVGTLFGAVHFLGWSSPFPSSHMQFLWRFATIVMTAVPPAAVILTLIMASIEVIFDLDNSFTYSLVLLPPLYLAGRGITIVLALVTLASLPLEAYRDVEWSDFFPHI